MQDLLQRATEIAALLKERRETLAIAESSTGGLLSAALLATPGASAFFLGGAIVYTRQARQALLGITDETMAAIRPATEAYALLLARTVQQRFGANWSLGETGATGPTGNRYGDPPGHAWMALTGASERALRLETGSADRVSNMRLFAAAALDMLRDALDMG
ncbi:MAG TPA: CinA family protein [Stellaceae bacterium]|nr:CinA family protein [Stellaceae bacterium]